MVWVLVLFVIGFVLFKFLKGSGPAYHWDDGAELYDADIVGESNYQKSLKVLAGEHGDRSADVKFIAYLIPEDDNEHDPKAVSIEIQGKLVGYLSRENARTFRRRLKKKDLDDLMTSCEAKIIGGFLMRNGERASYGVKLDIKPFF